MDENTEVSTLPGFVFWQNSETLAASKILLRMFPEQPNLCQVSWHGENAPHSALQAQCCEVLSSDTAEHPGRQHAVLFRIAPLEDTKVQPREMEGWDVFIKSCCR